MKKIIFFGVFLITLTAMAQSYFIEGTQWEITGRRMFGDFGYYTTLFWLKGDTIVNNKSCQKMWVSYSAEKTDSLLVTVIHNEGDKVYFKHVPESEEFDLMYDFGLSVGDSVEVCFPQADWTHRGQKVFSVVKNIGDTVSYEFTREFQVMKLQERDFPYYERDKSKWIKGIGSYNGPIRVAYFSGDGPKGSLKKVTYNGDVILEVKHDAINELNAAKIERPTGYHLSGYPFKNGDKGIKIEKGKKTIVR